VSTLAIGPLERPHASSEDDLRRQVKITSRKAAKRFRALAAKVLLHLRPCARAVLHALVALCDGEGVTWYSPRALARLCKRWAPGRSHYSLPAVLRALRELREAGLLAWERLATWERYPNGRKTPTGARVWRLDLEAIDREADHGRSLPPGRRVATSSEVPPARLAAIDEAAAQALEVADVESLGTDDARSIISETGGSITGERPLDRALPSEELKSDPTRQELVAPPPPAEQDEGETPSSGGAARRAHAPSASASARAPAAPAKGASETPRNAHGARNVENQPAGDGAPRETRAHRTGEHDACRDESAAPADPSWVQRRLEALGLLGPPRWPRG
jgi:hypothetical protein